MIIIVKDSKINKWVHMIGWWMVLLEKSNNVIMKCMRVLWEKE